ncbi:DUF4407 domain-containing protein [Hymenobacter perfusus]|uniref:DUF4407 domain-containing protein n=1 Tax=Hymenobacter perfusus TaxID=1236770 RepID=A0A3R9N4Q4_9BACT|nr:DUF4407 domain-containing protein [Hymenobacter perfusus]RSK38955.1 DUF4407 domain-containing protein [Hymenobacter perfusus]
MLKFASILIGEDPAYTAAFQPASKRKIILLASCLLLPVCLWFINGFLLVRQVIQGSLAAALVTATIAAVIIFLIERSVIMSRGNKVITAFRFMLGFVIALLGSISMDQVVFEDDISNRVASYRTAYTAQEAARVDSSYRARIEAQQQLVSGKDKIRQEALAAAGAEADGTAGSGIAKVGRIARLKLQLAGDHEKAYRAEADKLDKLKAECANLARAAQDTARQDFKGSALLLRLKAMHELIRADGVMLFVYLLFTATFFCFEFIVVVIKAYSEKSIDEKLEEAKEQLILFRAHKILENTSLPFEPQVEDSRIRNAQAAIGQLSGGKSRLL